MALATIPCPNCRAVLKSANPPPPGKRVRCPKCSETFLVPEAEPLPEAPVVEIDEDDDPAPVAEIDDDEDSAPPIRKRGRAEFPISVLVAGVIWVVYGGVLLLGTLELFSEGVKLVVHEDRQHAGPMRTIVVCVSVFVGAIAVAFIGMGVQSIRAASRDILWRSVVSIIFGVLGLLSAAAQLLMGNVLVGIMGFIMGAGLILAGVLALQARYAYKRWRSAQKG
jgi:predicted Zn finger-like uncharacterized protein